MQKERPHALQTNKERGPAAHGAVDQYNLLLFIFFCQLKRFKPGPLLDPPTAQSAQGQMRVEDKKQRRRGQRVVVFNARNRTNGDRKERNIQREGLKHAHNYSLSLTHNHTHTHTLSLSLSHIHTLLCQLMRVRCKIYIWRREDGCRCCSNGKNDSQSLSYPPPHLTNILTTNVRV